MNESFEDTDYEEETIEDLLEMYFRNMSQYKSFREQNYTKNIVIITLYSLIFFISLLGNSLVCYIIFSRRQMRTVTNYYIANLSLSDLMMTLINIPFNTARLLLDDWPFGGNLCKCLPFIQACSVYVSTLTMCVIGLDRHQAIVHPFGRRLIHVLPKKVIIPMMWIVASLFSLPHAYYNELVMFGPMVRCRMEFPEPQHVYRKLLTVLTFTSQYLIPLSIASISYIKIVLHIHRRGIVGNVTQQQIDYNLRSNRKTIKMLILVLVVFAVCWLPLNLYHILADFAPQLNPHNFIVFIAVHWLAMSSVCYNPFIYSVRNSHFRQGVKNMLNVIMCRWDELRKGSSGRAAHENCSHTRNTSVYASNRIDRNSCHELSCDRSLEMSQTYPCQTNSYVVPKPSHQLLGLCRKRCEEQAITDVTHV